MCLFHVMFQLSHISLISCLWEGLLIPFTGNVSLYYPENSRLIKQVHFHGLPQSDTAQSLVCGEERNVYIVYGRSVWRLSVRDNTTTRVSRMPKARDLPSLTCMSRTQLYVCGGRAEWSCDVMDTGALSWTRLLVNMPRSMYLHVAVESRNQMWLMGGYIYSEHSHDNYILPLESSQVYSYDPLLRIWTRQADMLEPRSNFGAVVTPKTGDMLVCGGGTEHLNSCELYEHETRMWVRMAPMRHGRFDHGMVLYHDRVYIMGGFCAKCPGKWSRNYRLTSIELYDHVHNRSDLSDVPLPFASTAVGAIALEWTVDNNETLYRMYCSKATVFGCGLLLWWSGLMAIMQCCVFL